jgi:Tol biopolymer transport system component
VQTTPVGTAAGIIVGTIGYMAPEQLRGLPVDRRADIFAFGAILYELLTGERAFSGGSSADAISAILKDDPPHLGNAAKLANGGLQRIVQRSIEKNREQRFQSAHDLAFALEAVIGTASASGVAPSADVVAAPAAARWRTAVAATAIALAGVAAGVVADRRLTTATPPPAARPATFRQLTFSRGQIFGARFTPDGQTVVYSAGMMRGRLFLSRVDSGGVTPLPFDGVRLFGVSPTAQLAFGIYDGRIPLGRMPAAMLAEAPLLGGASRPVLDKVVFADWNPRGGDMAIVRQVGSREQLEFPPGTVLFETDGQLGFPRVSPSGDLVAYLEWPVKDDDRGTVVIVDRERKRTTISKVWEAVRGLAWAPDGAEVWYTATDGGLQYAIHAAGVGRPEHRIFSAPVGLILEDIARDGRLLTSQYDRLAQVSTWKAGEPVDHDISWLDSSFARDLSADGSRVLLSSSGPGSSPSYDVYVCALDGSAATRIGNGQAQQLSPDGRSALSVVYGPPRQLIILPIGPGERTVVPTGTVSVAAARWLGDGRRLLLVGTEPGQRQQAYVLDLAGGSPRAIAAPGITYAAERLAVSPDGRRVVLRSPEGTVMIYAVDGAPPVAVKGLRSDEMPLGWSSDSSKVLVQEAEPRPGLVRVDPATGARERFVELHPHDSTFSLNHLIATPDGRTYVANTGRLQMTLYVAENLR